METSDHHVGDETDAEVYEDVPAIPRHLPADLPKSLYDRQPIQSFGGETEMYDAWQGRVRISDCFVSRRLW